MSRADSFFDGISQREIAIRGQRTYSPAFYRDVHMMLGIFTADLATARALLPSPRLRPLSAVPGKALVGINCFEYKDTDVGPYNEVGISIGVQVDDHTPGFLAVARSTISQAYHGHVLELPVTTQIALHGGLDFFNYPKFLAEITFEERGSIRSCRVTDPESNALIFEMTGERIATRRRQSGRAPDLCTFYSYPVKDGRLMKARFELNQIEKDRRLFGGWFKVTTGDHPRARSLADLRPGRLLQYVYAPRCQGILYEPEPI